MYWQSLAILGVTLGAGCTIESDGSSGTDPFAGLPREEYRYRLPDGRIAVGTGIRIGDNLLIEGDILIPAEAHKGGTASAAATFDTWPQRRVIYQFDPALDATTRQRVLSAMDPWKSAGIVFQQRTTQSWFVNITTEYPGVPTWVCRAGIGFNSDRTYNAGRDCRMRDFVHEWGHVLGLFHEHSRNDRDRFVTTDPAIGGTIGAAGFDLGPYDFGSIMHYDAYARNADGSVNFSSVLIRPVDGRPLDSFGWNDTPSWQDLLAIQSIYPEPPCGPGTGTVCP
jgi:hypothetical protein